MTRIKEPKIGTTTIIEYKSPETRIIKSLRTAYDNQREKRSIQSDKISSLRENLRDVTNSRETWKTKAKEADKKIKDLQKEIENLKMKNSEKTQ